MCIKRKSQIEIMGLAIIIILLMLALVFVVRFTLIPNQNAPKKEFSQAQIAANTLNAMLQTNVEECNEASIERLFVDCAQRTSVIDCGTGVGFVNSCDFLFGNPPGTDSFLKTSVFRDTLDLWEIPYTLTFNDAQEVASDSGDKKCSAEHVGTVYTSRDLKEAKIGLGGGSVLIVQLELCS